MPVSQRLSLLYFRTKYILQWIYALPGHFDSPTSLNKDELAGSTVCPNPACFSILKHCYDFLWKQEVKIQMKNMAEAEARSFKTQHRIFT